MTITYGEATGYSVQLVGPYGSVGSGAKTTTVTLPAAQWKNAVSPYFQTVTVAGISASSMVNIQLSKEQAAQLYADGTALHMENDGGTVTAWALGTKPASDLTVQVTLTEVVSA